MSAVPVPDRPLFEGRVFAVSVERVRLSHGREANMEVVRHPTSVILLPMPDPTHLLVRQPVPERECHEEIG